MNDTQKRCACGKPADCPVDDDKCQACWERECDAAWWDELRRVQEGGATV